jgi:hypothetical protein
LSRNAESTKPEERGIYQSSLTPLIAQRAQFENGFGSRESPARSGDIHPVLDQMTTSAFDDARGDR